MKRLILLIIVAMLVYWVLGAERSCSMRPAGHPAPERSTLCSGPRNQKALAKAGREVPGAA